MAAPLIIDGKTVAASVHAKSVEQIAEIKEKYGTVPGLAVILVGENPASQVDGSHRPRRPARSEALRQRRRYFRQDHRRPRTGVFSH